MPSAPSEDMTDNASSTDWSKAIRSTLQSSDTREVKKLRKSVLLSLQLDESDKTAKKQFKRTIQQLEEEGVLSLAPDGTITLNEKDSKKKRKREKEKEKKSKKEKKHKEKEKKTMSEKIDEKGDDEKTEFLDENSSQNENDDTKDEDGRASNTGENAEDPSSNSTEGKNKPCKGNPQGVTRLFVGNLPFSVDESSLGAFLPGKITHIKWITDKETGKFYGSAFIEMDNSISAAEAVAMSGEKLIGRPVKINFAPSREGDVWPPVKKVVSGGGQAGGQGVKAMSAKPDGCVKLFIGNLSYDIDDEGITKFFANVDAEVKAVRWLHHKESGDFKGCGYVEFWNPEACEKAATLNGKNLLGRPIRIDWTD